MGTDFGVPDAMLELLDDPKEPKLELCMSKFVSVHSKTHTPQNEGCQRGRTIPFSILWMVAPMAENGGFWWAVGG
jgi:hypothetical protein